MSDKIRGLRFSTVLDLLEAGYVARRKGWDSLSFARRETDSVGEAVIRKYSPGAHSTFWLVSQQDMIASDWEVGTVTDWFVGLENLNAFKCGRCQWQMSIDCTPKDINRFLRDVEGHMRVHAST